MVLSRFPLFVPLVWIQAVAAAAAAAQVEPPANVTLQCRNLNNVVKWSYGEFPPGLSFKVYIGAQESVPDPEQLLVKPPTLEADVSFLSNPNDAYYVAVTAVIGKNESDEGLCEGCIFSYFINSPSHQICFLDLPAVNVTAQEDGTIQVRFMHPWVLYHHKLPSGLKTNYMRKRSHDAQISERLPKFKYDVEIINQTKGHKRFTCDQSVCEGELQVSSALEEPCLNITGEMLRMSVRPTQEYCALRLNPAPHKPSNDTYIYIIVGVFLALFAVAAIVFMVYKQKTKPQSTLPNSMTFKSRLRQWTFGPDQEPFSVPEVAPTSPTPLLSTTEEKEESTPNVASTREYDFRLPIGVSAEDEGVCDDVEVGNNEGPGYMPGNNLEEEDESPPFISGYEKREVFVELAPDEQAEGYRG